MTANELKLMADVAVNSVTELGSSFPNQSLVFIDGNATFDATHSLQGGGILFVKGNLTISQGSNSFFNGFVYVTGNAVIRSPSLISGAIAVEGSVNIQGFVPVAVMAPGEISSIEYGETIINSLRQQVTQYRVSKTTSNPL
jgi:hypothetical protein